MQGINHFRNVSMLAPYAAAKHVPSPRAAVYFSGLLLILGGAGVILGIAPMYALICLFLFLVPTTFIMHQFWKETDGMQKMNNMINFMKNIALIGAVLMMFSIAAPWAASLF